LLFCDMLGIVVMVQKYHFFARRLLL